MADACIVCLGDLATHDPQTAHASHDNPIKSEPNGKASIEIHEEELLAHLLPCGHYLHDSCLKPWVERANSCPICRAKFHMVEISSYLHGPVLDSYAVQDKIQAPVDDNAVSATLDDAVTPDDHISPCLVCQIFGDESQLLLCDGCNQSCHVFCAGLDDIPAGAWFCYTCQEDGQLMHDNYVPRPVARRAAFRSQRSRQSNDNSTAWARLWRSVARSTGIDLEHPFDDDNQTFHEDQQRSNRRDIQQWQRRFQVAARAAGSGAANRLRQVAPPVSSSTQVPREPESQEEIRAWNAFEKARLIQEDGASHSRGRRKRRSRDTSPELEAPPITERQRKRPRLLRIQDPDVTEPIVGESSRISSERTSTATSRVRSERPEINTNAGPTFLQSLLDEVETYASTNSLRDNFDVNGDYFPYGIDRTLSPDAQSPCASSRASPGAMTPPPSFRPSSPTGLTSSIEPIYPPPPDFDPHSPVRIVEDTAERARSRQRSYIAQQSPGSSPTRQQHDTSNAPPRSSIASSPILRTANIVMTTLNPKLSTSNVPLSPPPPPPPHPPPPLASSGLDLETKTAIQSLVKAALKPIYNDPKSKLNSDHYTTINRDVSRLLYERVGTVENFTQTKGRWEAEALKEVKSKVKELSPTDISDETTNE